MKPIISVIVNCYNGERFLKTALDSIYAQTFKDWEIIFFDNNSNDQSATIAKSYDNKLVYYHNPITIPLGNARQKALDMCKGDWIAFLDTDDYWFPHNLEIQYSRVSKTDYVLSYAGIQEVTLLGSHIRNVLPIHSPGFILDGLLTQFDINIVTSLVNKNALLHNKLNFNPHILASEEYNLFMRLSAKGPFCPIPEILGVYRVSDTSLTTKSIEQWAIERRITLNQLSAENPGIDIKLKSAFKSAYVQSDYYEAQYLYSTKEYTKARKKLNTIREYSRIYFLLYIISFFPFAWRFIHKSKWKRILTSILNNFR